MILGYGGLGLFHPGVETACGHSRNGTGRVHQAIRNKKDKSLALLLALISFVFRIQVQGLQNQKKQALIDCVLHGLCSCVLIVYILCL